MSKPGLEQGVKLGWRDQRAIRLELVQLARTTTHRAYTLRWDGDRLYEFRAWPNGRVMRVRVNEKGLAVELPTRLLAGLLPARTAALAAGAAVAALDVLSRVL